MRAFVFTDPALASSAGQFVWLAIDTEKGKNAAFRQKYPVHALPTFFVVDPDSEKVALRWVGGMSVAQVKKVLDDGRVALAGGPPPLKLASKGTEGVQAQTHSADEWLVHADRLYGEGDNAAAAEAYQQALRIAPADWPRYGRAVEPLLFALQMTDSLEKCAMVAREAHPRLGKTSAAANVAASGLSCALGLPAEHVQRKEWVETFEAATKEAVRDMTLTMAGDDRSGLYGVLYDARKDAKDEEGAKKAASEWAGFLEQEAVRAKTPEQRAVFDPHRLAAYIELGQPERAIPMLEASERDFPDDYNPPARLATTYKEMKRWDQALAASDRALRHAYGPRKLRILTTRADIYLGLQDSTSARRTLEGAVSMAEALPTGQRSESTIKSLKKRLDGLK